MENFSIDVHACKRQRKLKRVSMLEEEEEVKEMEQGWTFLRWRV